MCINYMIVHLNFIACTSILDMFINDHAIWIEGDTVALIFLAVNVKCILKLNQKILYAVGTLAL